MNTNQIVSNPVAAQGRVVSIMAVQQGVAVIQIKSPPANAFGDAVARDLKLSYEEAIANDEVKAIVITGDGKFFMAGADINRLQKMTNANDPAATKDFLQAGHDLINRIESGPKPVVAAVNGICFGGGLELAMACSARVGFKLSAYGLPELKLGIIPGLGGTQRLPRLIGLQAAVDATLKSKTIKAKKALKLGLIDAIAKKPKDLIMQAGKLAMQIAFGQVPRRKSLYLTDKIGDKDVGNLTLTVVGKKIAKKSKGAPHPAAFLEAVRVGLNNGGEAGIQEEMKQFGAMLATPTCKSLIHVFFASQASSKLPGAPKKSSYKIKTVAVLGGGTMGSGICIVYLMRGYNVVLKEINQKYLDNAVLRIANIIGRFIKKKKMHPMTLEYMMRNLTPTLSYDCFKNVDLVIEAVLENIGLKQKIFADLEKVCHANTILATNTSTIDIDLVAEKTNAKDRILGLHFFSPAHIMPLLEIIKTKNTSMDVLSACVGMSKKIGKTPVVVGNCVGFTANRMFFPYGMSAGFLADRGVHPYAIDKALVGMGMPMGVFRMSDLSGVDIANHVGGIIKTAYGERTYSSTLAKQLMDVKRLGEKTKVGYYKYAKNKPVEDKEGLQKFLDQARRDAGNPSALTNLSAKDLAEIVMFPVVNEGFRIVGEGHVIRESDVDIASIMGYGFPALKGGVLFWGRQQGLKYVVDRLNYFAQTYGAKDPAIQRFFKPCDTLVQQAAQS